MREPYPVSLSERLWPYGALSIFVHTLAAAPLLLEPTAQVDMVSPTSWGVVFQKAEPSVPEQKCQEIKSPVKQKKPRFQKVFKSQSLSSTREGEGVVPVTGNPAPIYPEEARQQGLEGVIEIRAHISPTGHVRFAEVLSRDKPAILADAALAAVRKWKFTLKNPPKKEMILEIPIRFELKRN